MINRDVPVTEAVFEVRLRATEAPHEWPVQQLAKLEREIELMYGHSGAVRFLSANEMVVQSSAEVDPSMNGHST